MGRAVCTRHIATVICPKLLGLQHGIPIAGIPPAVGGDPSDDPTIHGFRCPPCDKSTNRSLATRLRASGSVATAVRGMASAAQRSKTAISMRATSRGIMEHPRHAAGAMGGERGFVQQEMPESDLGQCSSNSQAFCHKAFLILAV